MHCFLFICFFMIIIVDEATNLGKHLQTWERQGDWEYTAWICDGGNCA